jgi:hypothetical protein
MLDLALCTPNLTPWVTSYKVVDNYSGSDHKPIKTTVQISIACTNLQPKRNFKRTNVDTVKAGAKWLRLPGQPLDNA